LNPDIIDEDDYDLEQFYYDRPCYINIKHDNYFEEFEVNYLNMHILHGKNKPEKWEGGIERNLKDWTALMKANKNL